ncbi:MAG: poly[(R)-3-hydroxyalkanoate] polymerase subunit PhaC [Hyphomicrobiales bacterium]|jgi:polyhydroxyalkanoate synthase|nr:poly[(R)-3-hydroxyalkanoate] polymerase subunit PhaC [Hyphomicrobiales bacterium]
MSGVEDFASDIRRSFAQFVDDALAKKDSGAPGSTAKQILFLLGEGTRLLESLRAKISDAPPSQDSGPAPGDEGIASPIQGRGIVETIQLILAQALARPERLAEHYAAFAEEALKIFNGTSELEIDAGDHRFKDSLWKHSALHRVLLQLYLAWRKTMAGWLAEQTLEKHDRKRADFIFGQLVAALAPSNLPLNPAALKRARDSDGESAVNGLQNWIADLIANGGMPRQVRPDAYEIGRDLATTPGAVIYRNPQLELIQYGAQTPLVHRRPVLLVPPQINKYYVFDLRPANSLIGHAVQSGFQMFAISWRNPGEAEAHWDLNTYVASTLQAIEVIRSTTKSRKVGMISACAGGLTAMAVLGYLAEIGEQRVSSHSLLVTSLFATNESPLELFATPALLDRVRRYVGETGVMDGAQLAKVFAWLRPDDLVWRYWVNNYLMGRNPPPLDVLYWDNDSTRLPGALNGDFLDMYDRDVFRNPHRLKVLDRPIDFRKVKVDSYFLGGQDDYLMPWSGCYEACKRFGGRHEFVLSTSGHVQSVLRPPRLAKAVYFTNDAQPDTPAEWLATASRHDGTWWSHWHRWLAAASGATKAAPKRLGNGEFPPLTEAPGTYVHTS